MSQFPRRSVRSSDLVVGFHDAEHSLNIDRVLLEDLTLRMTLCVQFVVLSMIFGVICLDVAIQFVKSVMTFLHVTTLRTFQTWTTNLRSVLYVVVTYLDTTDSLFICYAHDIHADCVVRSITRHDPSSFKSLWSLIWMSWCRLHSRSHRLDFSDCFSLLLFLGKKKILICPSDNVRTRNNREYGLNPSLRIRDGDMSSSSCLSPLWNHIETELIVHSDILLSGSLTVRMDLEYRSWMIIWFVVARLRIEITRSDRKYVSPCKSSILHKLIWSCQIWRLFQCHEWTSTIRKDGRLLSQERSCYICNKIKDRLWSVLRASSRVIG